MFLVEEGGKCVMLAEGVLHLLYLYSILFVIVSLNELRVSVFHTGKYGQIKEC